MKKSSGIPQRKAALIAGVSLLLMTVIAGFTYGYLHGNLVVAEDSQATMENLKSSTGMFYTEIFGWTVIFLLDGLVAWSLYHFFAKANRLLSFFSSFLRVLYTAVLGLAIYNLPKVMTIITDHLASVHMDSGTTEVMNYLNSFEDIWSKGLIIFGFHLMALGCLVFKADYVPKLWGVLLLIAGASYSYISTMHIFFLEIIEYLTVIESILTIPMIIGEVGFAIWLVARGGRNEKEIAPGTKPYLV